MNGGGRLQWWRTLVCVRRCGRVCMLCAMEIVVGWLLRWWPSILSIEESLFVVALQKSNSKMYIEIEDSNNLVVVLTAHQPSYATCHRFL